MRAFRRLGFASAALLLVLLATVSKVGAAMAVIETAAQLNEHTSEGVKAAVMAAVETAARGAKAMGLSQVTVRGVRVLPEAVVVQVVATDDAAGSSPQEDPDDDTGRSLHDGQPNSQERL